MIVPDSVMAAYEHQQAVLVKVSELAGGRLRELCKRKHWLYGARTKPVESALVKLEAGKSPDLASMEDLWAALVVVPTTAEVPTAAQALLQLFQGTQKPRRSRDPNSFPYDDVHVTVRLGSTI